MAAGPGSCRESFGVAPSLSFPPSITEGWGRGSRILDIPVALSVVMPKADDALERNEWKSLICLID